MSEYAARVVETVSAWNHVTVEDHRFGGQEFRLGNVEVGHVHQNGLVDIPFTRPVREHLVEAALAEPHHILPESGWISFYMRRAADIERALWLLRLSYVQKRISRNRRDNEQMAELLGDLDSLQISADLRDLIA